MFDSSCGVNGAHVVAGGGPAPTGIQSPALPGLPLRFSDPLRMLLCWAALLYSEGTLDARLLKYAGIGAEDLAALAEAGAQDLAALRELRLAGLIFGRANIALLLRARLAEMLMGATKSSDLVNLMKTIERAPQWLFEEEGSRDAEPRVKGRGSSEEGKGREDEDDDGEEMSDEEIARAIFGDQGPSEEQIMQLRGFSMQFREAALREIEDAEMDGEKMLRLTEALQVMDAIDAAALTGESLRKAKRKHGKARMR